MTTESKSAVPSLDDLVGAPPAELPPLGVPSRILETIALRFLARVIHADGVIHPAEVSKLVGVATSLGMSGAEAQRILEDEFSRQSDCAVLAAQIPDVPSRRQVFALGCLMGAADGGLDPTEKAVLDAYQRGAGIPDQDAREILDEVLKATQAAAKPA